MRVDFYWKPYNRIQSTDNGGSCLNTNTFYILIIISISIIHVFNQSFPIGQWTVQTLTAGEVNNN